MVAFGELKDNNMISTEETICRILSIAAREHVRITSLTISAEEYDQMLEDTDRKWKLDFERGMLYPGPTCHVRIMRGE